MNIHRKWGTYYLSNPTRPYVCDDFGNAVYLDDDAFHQMAEFFLSGIGV